MTSPQKQVPRPPISRSSGKRLESYQLLSILPPVSAPGSPTPSNNTSTDQADEANSSSEETPSSDHETSLPKFNFSNAPKLQQGLASPDTDTDIPVLQQANESSSTLSEADHHRNSDGANDDDDDDDDEFDSDFSIDSATVFLPESTTSAKPKIVNPPSKLDIPVPPKKLNLDHVDEASSSELSVISDNELNELEASIVDLKEITRATTPQTDGEYNDTNLLALLSEDESSIADADESDAESGDDGFFDYDDEDDDSIEEREELAIVEEVQRSGDLEEHHVGYNTEADSSESDISFSNDAFFEPRAQPPKNITSSPNKGHSDDEYMFSYFGTSEQDSDDAAGLDDYSANALAVALEDSDYSDDETDEDKSLPRNKFNSQSKPTEILSSSATTSRPPVLGSWVMSTERPYGIIDGLTTRTLSPPADSTDRQLETPKRARAVLSDSDASELALEDFIYTSELDEPEDLGVYSTTFEEHGGVVNKDIPLSAFRNRSSSVAAHQQFPVLSFQASPLHRRASSSVTRRGGGTSLGELGRRASHGMSLTPSKGLSRRVRKKQRHSGTKKEKTRLSLDFPGRSPRSGSGAGPAAEFLDEVLMSGDLIDELVGLGAVSPLFGGLA